MDYVKPLFIGILLQFSTNVSKAQDVTVSPEGPVVVPEGDILAVTCTDRTSVGQGNLIVIDRNGISDTSIPRDVNGSVVTYFIGPVTLSDNGTVYRCAHGVLSVPTSSNIILLVRCEYIYYSAIIARSRGTVTFTVLHHSRCVPSHHYMVFQSCVHVRTTCEYKYIFLLFIKCKKKLHHTAQMFALCL